MIIYRADITVITVRIGFLSIVVYTFTELEIGLDQSEQNESKWNVFLFSRIKPYLENLEVKDMRCFFPFLHNLRGVKQGMQVTTNNTV